MGSGIAEVAAKTGHTVVLRSRKQETADAMLASLEKSLTKQVERGKLSEDDKAATLGRVTATAHIGALADCDLIIESVVEDLAVKTELFTELDGVVKESAILATNTSTLSVVNMAVVTERPDKVVGVHFFNPAPMMSLVEIIRPLTASDETVAEVTAFARTCGKDPVEVQDRAGETDWFFGPRYAWLKVNPAFGDGWPADLDGRPLREVRIGRLSLVGAHDTRDNIFTPTDGHFVEAELVAASPQLGGTSSYQQVNLRGFDWIPMGKPFILALRGDVQTSRGDIPFFAKPFVNLRGIPAVRYQDNNAAVAEVELWWQATPRWSLLGFTGAGRAWGRRDTFSQAETVSTVGAGFRYLIARKLGLHAGIDFATGPQGRAFYIQVGSPWR